MHPSHLHLAAEPTVTEVQAAGLRALDNAVTALGARGIIRAVVRCGPHAAAVEQHILRAARLTGRAAFATLTGGVDSVFRDLLARLDARRIPSDPAHAARAFCAAASNAVIVVRGDLARGGWDEEVVRELERAPGSHLLVLLETSPGALGEPSLLVPDDPGEDADLWWRAVLRELSSRMAGRGLIELESWWTAVRNAPTVPAHASSVGQQGRSLWRSLRAARRSWPAEQIGLLGEAAALPELVTAALVRLDSGYVVAEDWSEGGEATEQELRCVAEALKHSDDPYLVGRAAALLLGSGELAEAEQGLSRCVRVLDGTAARREVWEWWCEAMGRVDARQRGALSLRTAELALELEDVDHALRLIELAGASGLAEQSAASLLHGRALLARGDLVAARVAFDRALAGSHTPEERAAALANLAEVAYNSGDMALAQQHAERALESGVESGTKLSARNTLGKILLARSEWESAEAHFAADEYDAACAGLETARMRARLNRAIALLSRGCYELARPLFGSVLDQAQRRRDARAEAFALSNLAVLATHRSDYGEALELSERAIDVRRRLGDKIGLVRVVANLADLRLRLGLLDQAEQVLAFGRRTLAPGMPQAYAAVFALQTASILYARGRTSEALRELSSALAGISGWTDGARLGECHRLGARIALDDGDTQRVAACVRQAIECADSAYARAEVALLQAHLERAEGRSPGHRAHEALTLAREAGDTELLREVNLFLSEVARAEEDWDVAQSHLDASLQLRDTVSASLPEGLRPAYLGRRDVQAVSRAQELLREARGRSEEAVPSSTVPRQPTMPMGFVGRHPSVQRLLGSVRKVARSSAPVLILGESGTGKELVSEAIHALSDRCAGPLVKVNCAALVETLLLSELFGHEKGSFTGAAGRRRGRFEVADGGTLFLDEIGDISARTQVALLRVLQDHTFERVGGTTPIRTDVRVVCATHRDLRSMVAAGTFREDLYYRLCGVTLEIPPLRKRVEDIDVIAEHLLATVARERNEAPRRLSTDAMVVLRQHGWPGNVRELDNVLRACALFAEGELIGAPDVCEQLHITRAPDPPEPPVDTLRSAPVNTGSGPAPDTARVAYDEIRTQGTSLSDLKRTIERDCIQRALSETGGNITKAATLLGMKRPRLSQLVKQYGLLENISEDC